MMRQQHDETATGYNYKQSMVYGSTLKNRFLPFKADLSMMLGWLIDWQLGWRLAMKGE